ncbi:pyrimidine reductase family protein [Corynebacterium uropygiale]|uniref:Pyrimidine reductase family protein n=1 Tax=Corynebacterium uropygiale TaxID=1775911 RepID=A0A9X1QPM8_9CORY|nr:pyrimidine reductase family protein [Corynebacterium uropygiale]MCF4006511.1 pyrimidine reductase family protein [Corynebacterium uropygiale]
MSVNPLAPHRLHEPHKVSTLLGPLLPCGTPQTRMVGIMALNGSAAVEGSSGSMGSAADARLLTELREWSDAVLVSAATVRTEGYRPMSLPDDLRLRREHDGRPSLPRLAILTPSLSLEPSSEVLGAPLEAPPLVISTVPATDRKEHAARRRALEQAGAEVLLLRSLSPRVVLCALREAGYARISVEGGPSLYSRVLAEDVVDILHLSLDPHMPTHCALPLVDAAGEREASRRYTPEAVAADAEGVLFLRYRRARGV